MNIYDFDKTIYYPNSMRQFCFYCIFHHISLWKLYVPTLILLAPFYACHIIKKSFMVKMVYRIIRFLKNPDEDIKIFWSKHETNIRGWYLNAKQPTDLIISASPEYLVKPLTDKLGVKLIATKVDRTTGKIVGDILIGKGKARYVLEQNMPMIDYFYSDSLVDTPIALLAEHAYLVKKEELIPWPHIKDIKERGIYKKIDR